MRDEALLGTLMKKLESKMKANSNIITISLTTLRTSLSISECGRIFITYTENDKKIKNLSSILQIQKIAYMVQMGGLRVLDRKRGGGDWQMEILIRIDMYLRRERKRKRNAYMNDGQCNEIQNVREIKIKANSLFHTTTSLIRSLDSINFNRTCSAIK